MTMKEKIAAAVVLSVLVTTFFGPCAAAGDEDLNELTRQAQVAMLTKKYDRAIRLYTKAIARKPKLYTLYHQRAIAYSKSGQYDKSVADLKTAIREEI